MHMQLGDGSIVTAEVEGSAVRLEISKLRGAWLGAQELRELSANLIVLAEGLAVTPARSRVPAQEGA
jgi:hypothetical protein